MTGVMAAARGSDVEDRWRLAAALAEVGRAVRVAVGLPGGATDAEVLRTEGGDDVFGVDGRAEGALVAAMQQRCGPSWPGTLVLEGHDHPLTIGRPGGPWRYLADPVDGSRPWMWSKRSAWVLLGAGRDAATLDALEVSACVELPVPRTAVAMSAWAVRGEGVRVVDEPVPGPGEAVPTGLQPLTGGVLAHRFVSVMRFAIGTKGAIGDWEDRVLAGLEVFEDPFICSGGLLMEVAAGRQAAVLDPRPVVVPGSMASHPYDLAGWIVAAEAGVRVELLGGGPLLVPLDTTTPVAWAAYANDEVAGELRRRIAAVDAATDPRPATSAPAPPGTG